MREGLRWQPCVVAALLVSARAEGAEADSAAPHQRSGRAEPRPAPPGDGATPISALLQLSFGRGVRFNNPYRLATPLGDTAESVSLAATYLDLGGALLFGPGDFRHGVSLGGAVALQGIGQLVLT